MDWDALLIVTYDRWTELRADGRRGAPVPRSTLDMVRMTLAEDIADPEHAATQLLAMYEGLQIQILVRPHVDVLREYDLAAQTLRQGWRTRPVPTWDLTV
ncbi:hypothetical protein [Curtobacterium sp. RRHDQ10]|uniref:hypothetical protein n=1 Tax=Curtobacterium phyllosphaerae TaxID=3413379 RepID=UPI003BF13100